MDKKSAHRIISIVLFAIYACVLVYFLFFAENMGRTVTLRTYNYNLIPFKEIKRFLLHRDVIGNRAVLINLVGNVLAFVPFGLFIVPVLNRQVGFKEVLLLSFDVSLLVELLQLFTKKGSFDVDDLLLNTLGGIIGGIVYFSYKIYTKNRNEIEKETHSGQV